MTFLVKVAQRCHKFANKLKSGKRSAESRYFQKREKKKYGPARSAEKPASSRTPPRAPFICQRPPIRTEGKEGLQIVILTAVHRLLSLFLSPAKSLGSTSPRPRGSQGRSGEGERHTRCHRARRTARSPSLACSGATRAVAACGDESLSFWLIGRGNPAHGRRACGEGARWEQGTVHTKWRAGGNASGAISVSYSGPCPNSGGGPGGGRADPGWDCSRRLWYLGTQPLRCPSHLREWDERYIIQNVQRLMQTDPRFQHRGP